MYTTISRSASRISFNFLPLTLRRDSVDSEATGWTSWGSNPGRSKYFSVLKIFDITSAPPPPPSPTQWKVGLFPGRTAVFLSPSSSAEAKNEWSYTSTPLHMPSWRGEGHSCNAPVLSTFLKIFYIIRVKGKLPPLQARVWPRG
jgi:hypothetical protein